jgi:ATP-binding cassette, subfamily B, bacterial
LIPSTSPVTEAPRSGAPAASPGAPNGAKRSILDEIGSVWNQRQEVWALVSRADKVGFGLAIAVMAGVAFTETAIAVLLGRFFDHVLETGIVNVLAFCAWSLALLAAAYFTKDSLLLLRRWLVHKTSSRIERDMTVRLSSHLLKIDLGVLKSDRLGTLHGRATRAVEGFVKFLKVGFTDFFPAILTAGFALGAGLVADWRVGLVMASVVPLAIVITVIQLRAQRDMRIGLLKSKEGLDGALVELLDGIEYIRVANTHRYESRRIQIAAEQRRARELKHQISLGKYEFLKALNEGLFHVATIATAIALAARGDLDVGAIVTFSFLFLNVMRPLREVHKIFEDAYDGSIQVGVLLNMLKEPIDESFAIVTQQQADLGGRVPLLDCRDLVVEYQDPSAGTRRALDGITLAIAAGQTIGVAGPSGSGKSTWLRALLRLIHPASGTVLVGGVPIAGLSREDIGKLIGYVSQTPFVFSGTVRANIAYEKPDATDEQVEAAAQSAYLHDEIIAMPDGYESVLDERGTNLSGGQRQRLALARMFLKNPPILLLDEGTSALDNISERQVRDAIMNVRKNRTVIMVAHRLTSLSDADCIFVFDGGRIVERGTYEELVEQDGVFAELVRSAESE